MNRFARHLEHLRFAYGPRLSRRLADLSTYRARRFLKETGPIGVLVDNTVLGHATTHETAWISTGDQAWGPHTIKTGYAARIPVHAADPAAREYEHVRYLPGLISLARNGHVTLYSSGELDDERFYQPSGRFRGYGYCDHNLFEGVEMKSIDGIAFPTLGPSRMGLPGAEDQKRERLRAEEASDSDYASLVAVLGRKNSQDAWHIRTAETHGLFCFLTMDFSLMKCLESQKNAPRIRGMKTLVMTPADLGSYLKLPPIAPHLSAIPAPAIPYVVTSHGLRGGAWGAAKTGTAIQPDYRGDSGRVLLCRARFLRIGRPRPDTHEPPPMIGAA
jgi:hypothetical protein